ncbi:hypothetical protein PR048_020944 [Dryococelus australis]|uniref:Uncharacterized protein n=1 Tax=Dryococelus australis TaxID=614101 RepID=A0ABQ9GWU9_9NEOP|nr:hypothetical protein PR048_020944 [Dryococelus australis]
MPRPLGDGTVSESARGVGNGGPRLNSPVRLLASHQGELCSTPGRFTPDFRKWESWRTMPLVGGFSLRSPVSPASSFGTAPYSPHFILIGSQNLAAVKYNLRQQHMATMDTTMFIYAHAATYCFHLTKNSLHAQHCSRHLVLLEQLSLMVELPLTWALQCRCPPWSDMPPLLSTVAKKDCSPPIMAGHSRIFASRNCAGR